MGRLSFLPFGLLLAMLLLGGPHAHAQDAGPTPPAAEPSSCTLCHGVRTELFRASAHGTARDLDCLDCHTDATQHADSFGQTPASTPRALPVPESRNLCATCHDPGGSPFQQRHIDLATEKSSCLDCHDFHRLTAALDARPPPRRSHGLPVPEEVAAEDVRRIAGFQIEDGILEVGGRGVDGNDRAFHTYTNLEPGFLLRRATLNASKPADTPGVDHLALDVVGVGDPATRGSLELGDTGSWNLTASARHSDDLFAPTTELHDTFTERTTIGADLELLRWDGVDVNVGYEHFRREEDARLSRYRSISNQLFDPVDGRLTETADLVYLSTGWTRGDWQIHAYESIRWWEVKDSRSFLEPTVPVDDAEDYDALSDAWTPSGELRIEGPVADGSAIFDFEAFFAYSERDTDAHATSSGIDAGGAPFLGLLDSDGTARGRYARLETGLLYELQENVDATLRVRYRHRRETASTTIREEIESPPGNPPVLTVTDVDSSADHRTLDLEAQLLSRVFEWLDLDVGYGARLEHIELEGPNDASSRPTTHGLLLDARARASEELSFRGRLRAYTTDDPYTRISAEHEALASIDVRWTPRTDLALDGGVSTSRIELAADGSNSDLDAAFLQVLLGEAEGALTAELGVSAQDYDINVETIAQVSGFPVPYSARFDGSAVFWYGGASLRPTDTWQLRAELSLTETRGDNRSRLIAASLASEHSLRDDLILRLSVASWDFDGTASDQDDFQTNVFEVSLRYLF